MALAAPDPRDSQYNAGVARLLFTNKNQRDQITQAGDQDTQDFGTMLQRMADQRTNDLLQTNYNANKQGLFYSGQLGKQRGIVEKDYSQRQGDAQTDYDRRKQARQQALDQLGTFTASPTSPTGYTATGGAGLDLTDLYNAAVERRTQLDQAAADRAAALQIQQQAAAPPPAAAAAARPAAPALAPQNTRAGLAARGLLLTAGPHPHPPHGVSPQNWDARGFWVYPTTVGGKTGVWHQYPDGHKVFVKH